MSRSLLTNKAAWVVFFALVLFLLNPHNAHAAYLYLDPPSQNVQVGTAFTLKLNINTEGQKVQAAEAWIDYNTDEVSVVSILDPVEADRRFTNNLLQKSTTKLIYIANWIALGTEAVSTPPNGMAVLTLKTMKAGTFNLRIKCTQGDTRDSAITARINKKTEDLIDCSKVVNSTIVSGGASGGATATPGPATATPGRGTPTAGTSPTTIVATLRPTNTGAATATPTTALTSTVAPTRVANTISPTGGVGGADASPSALPKTGETDAIGVAVGIGVVLTIVSVLVKVLIL